MNKDLQLIQEILNIPANKFNSGRWYKLVFTDIDPPEKRIVGIRKIEVDKNMKPECLMSYLADYFTLIESDIRLSENNICEKGCCSCCTSDFEVSIAEYFAILNYIGIRYGRDSIRRISEQAKLSLNSPMCIFVDRTDGSCGIYEVRPLLCRKYGLYESSTDCPRLTGKTLLLDKKADTAKNTLYFEIGNKSSSRIFSKPKRIVQWFANMENGDFSSQKMNDLFFAAFNKHVDEFVQILIR